MVSSLTRNQVPGNRLRVRIPCPPLLKPCVAKSYAIFFSCHAYNAEVGNGFGAMRVLCLERFPRVCQNRGPGVRHPRGSPRRPGSPRGCRRWPGWGRWGQVRTDGQGSRLGPGRPGSNGSAKGCLGPAARFGRMAGAWGPGCPRAGPVVETLARIAEAPPIWWLTHARGLPHNRAGGTPWKC